MVRLVEPRRNVDVGRVAVTVNVSNYEDILSAQRIPSAPQAARHETVEALVDTGATFLCLPEEIVARLGIPFNRMRPTRTVVGVMEFPIHSPVQIEVEGRVCTAEVMVLPTGRQPLLGQIPLELLDFWVDPVNQRLVGNPEHGGQWMAEAY